MPQKYALVIGNGRSGTNWLLTMLDASPLTHCRNEPQEIAQSPFRDLPSAEQLHTKPDLMSERWDSFATWTGKRMGERDHRIKAPKNHVHSISQSLGIAYWPARPKIRKTLSFFWPTLRRGEWQMPWWIGSQYQLSDAYAIFKVNDLRAWYVRWLLKERPQIPILHLVRHPGGQLNSGINRFFSCLSAQELEQERCLYVNILKTAGELDPHWQGVFGNVDNMELIEAVAWFWRYNNEEIYRIGKEQSNYMFLTYEQLAADPLGYAKRCYNLCGIDWNRQVEDFITNGLSSSMWGKLSQTPQEIANNWRGKLESKYQTLAERVLESSVLKCYWDV